MVEQIVVELIPSLADYPLISQIVSTFIVCYILYMLFWTFSSFFPKIGRR